MSPVYEKPILHGRDHRCGGADEIPGICDLFPVAGTIDEAILATAPGAYYKLDETGSDDWQDSSPGNRDATYVSRTGTVRGVASGLDEGDGSLCVTVDGGAPGAAHTATYVGAANIADGWFDFSGTAPMSVTARVRPASFSSATGFFQGLCGVTTDAAGGWGLFVLSSGGFSGSQGRVLFARSTGVAGILDLYSSLPLVIGDWTRITGTYDGTTVRLYFDSTAVGSAADSTSLPSGSQTFFIGGCGTGSAAAAWAPFDGEVDSVAVWDRALAPSEVGGIAAFETGATATAAEGWVLTSDGAGGISYAAPTIEVEF